MTYKLWIMMAVIALVAVLGTGMATPRPAHANDAAAIIAGAAIGYLVYDSLRDRGDHGYCSDYGPPRGPNYDPPRGGYYGSGWGYGDSPRRTYNRGYRDGWDDGESYGYRRGWDNGYRTGYDDGSWGHRGGSYCPPPVWGGGWCY
jgi:hypothetical protein